LNEIHFLSSFLSDAIASCERTRQSAAPVANTPEEIALFGPTVIPGIKEGLVFFSYFIRTKKSYFRRIAFIGGKVQSIARGG
jgi:hypothetical protein